MYPSGVIRTEIDCADDVPNHAEPYLAHTRTLLLAVRVPPQHDLRRHAQCVRDVAH
jgi:hypothetical protein